MVELFRFGYMLCHCLMWLPRVIIGDFPWADHYGMAEIIVKVKEQAPMHKLLWDLERLCLLD
jgi:hypothetical protein